MSALPPKADIEAETASRRTFCGPRRNPTQRNQGLNDQRSRKNSAAHDGARVRDLHRCDGGAAKAKPPKQRPPRIVALEERPLTRPDGKPVWKWVRGKTLDGKPKSIKVPVKLVICTTLKHGKKYPHCSLGSRPIRKTNRRGCCAFLSGFKAHAVGRHAKPRRFTDRANPQRQHPI